MKGAGDRADPGRPVRSLLNAGADRPAAAVRGPGPTGGLDRPRGTDRGGPPGAGTDRRGPPGAGTDRPPPTVTSVNRPRTSTRWWARVIRDARGELRRAGLEIALLGPAQRAARGQPVVDPGGLPVAGHLEQVRAHRVDPVMPGERGVRGRSGFGRGQLPQTRRRAVHRDPRPGRHRRWGCRLLSQPEPAVRHGARRPAEVRPVVPDDRRPAQDRRQLADHPRTQLDALLHGRVLRAALDPTP